MLQTYLQLTDSLLTNVIGNIIPLCSRFSNKLAENDEFVHKSYYKDSQLALTIAINQVSDTISSVNFVLSGDSSAQSVRVDWKSGDLPAVELPVDSINIPSDVISRFEAFLKTTIDFDKLEKSLGVMESTRDDGKRTHVEEAEQQRPINHSLEGPKNVLLDSGIRGDRRRPADMPDFDDEYEMQRPAGPPPTSRGFPSIGHGDLDPPGVPKNPLLQPYIDPLHPQGDGGMYPSPDHPLFGSQSSARRGVPPGARYDDPMGEQDFDMVGNGLPGGMRGPGGFPGL